MSATLKTFVMLACTALLAALAGCASQQEQKISALHHFKRGNRAYHAENYVGAVRHYRQAVSLDSKAPDILYNLGLAFFRSDNFPEAIGAFQQALEINPEMADAHYNLALAFDKMYNPTAAHAHYNRYRELNAQAVQVQGGVNKSLSAKPGAKAAGGIVRKNPPAGRTARSTPNGKEIGKRPPGAHPVANRPPARSDPRWAQREHPRLQHPIRKSSTGASSKWWTQDKYLRTQ